MVWYGLVWYGIWYVVCALSVLYCVVLCFALLLHSGVLLQPLFVHFINFLQLKTQVSSRSRSVSVLWSLFSGLWSRSRFVRLLRTAFAFSGISNTQNECQPGRPEPARPGHTPYKQAAAQQQQQHEYDANAGTVNVSVCVCVCVCIRSFVRSVRFVGLFALCAQSRGNAHTPLHAHSPRTCVSDSGNAFIVCVAEQKFCCSSLYEHTATAMATATAAATASLCTVAGYT